MERRTMLKMTSAAALVTAAPFNIGTASAGPDRRPIVVVIIDDRMDFAALDRYIPTWPRRSVFDPWLRSYARRNLWFTNAHTASPSCGSSRPAMLWGVPPHESGIMTQVEFRKWETTLADQRSIVGQLRDQGWRTYGYGKVFHSQQLEQQPDCWTEYTPNVTPETTIAESPNNYFGYESPTFDPYGPVVAGPQVVPDHAKVSKALTRLSRLNDGDAVFIGITKPHLPLQIPAPFFRPIDPTEIVLPEPGPRLVGDAARFQRGAFASDMAGVMNADEHRELIWTYLAAVKYADFEFGRIIRSTPANARVIITSDHGFALGERGAFSKQTMWDQSTAIPMVIGGVGQRGKVRTTVSALDLPATIRDMAGIAGPGDSLVTIASQPTDKERAALTSYRAKAAVGSPIGHSVRRHYDHLISYSVGSEVFYWLWDDPTEQRNRIRTRRLQGRIDELRRLIPG